MNDKQLSETTSAGRTFSQMLTSLSPLFGLALVLIIFTAINGPSFLSKENVQAIMSDAAIVAIAALGMTLVIISGGIDLSTGSIVALSSVICAKAIAGMHYDEAGTMTLMHWAVVFSAGIGMGMLCGAINGCTIVGLRVAPFIATLGMLSVARGAAKWASGNIPIDTTSAFGNWVQPFVESDWNPLAPSIWLAMGLAVVVAVVLLRTVFGRHIVALGSSEPTARLCGLRVGWMKIAIYTIAGACAGLAGVVQTARLTRGDPSVAVGLELNVIASVVIGGGSLMGGEGSILGTLAGALVMSALSYGATQAGWENYVQEILVGLIIVLAVSLDQWRARRRLS